MGLVQCDMNNPFMNTTKGNVFTHVCVCLFVC